MTLYYFPNHINQSEHYSELFLHGITSRSTRGVDISQGGDVITKTIRLRYKHLKGWIEDQENIKVRSIEVSL